MDDTSSSAKLEARKSYYADAQSWASDRSAIASKSLRVTRIIAISAAAVAVLEAFVLIAMLPLKTVVPYTILVDRHTGYAQQLDTNAMPDIKPESALTQSLLAQYVVARETFDINNLQAQYRKVALWSDEVAKRDYLAVMPASSPDSPINRYPRTTLIQTGIESVTPTGPSTAMVRFYTERRDRGQTVGPRSYWVSLVRFRFSKQPLALEDRLINPLGFQVIHYRRDQEAPPPPQTVPESVTVTTSLVPRRSEAAPDAVKGQDSTP